MTAAATCVFQSLSHTSGPALERALLIVEKLKALNSRMVQSVLYERAKIFFEQFPRIASAKTQPRDGEVRSKDVSEEIQASSSRLIDILFGPKTNETEPESTRMKRAVLAVAYANCAVASETGRLTRLTTILENWLGIERSGPIRETVKRALLAIRMRV
jgi:hypothetical protein